MDDILTDSTNGLGLPTFLARWWMLQRRRSFVLPASLCFRVFRSRPLNFGVAETNLSIVATLTKFIAALTKVI